MQKALPSFRRPLDLKRSLDLARLPLEQVEARLNAQICTFDPGIAGYVEYVCANHGKRIRPALALLAAEATGGIQDTHLDLALIVELIHMATLVHDDIIDGAQMRRNKNTANAKWGSEISVLLGDCLFSHALVLCTRLPGKEIGKQIAEAANEVCTGEILQTQRRFDLKMSSDEYLRIIRMKTGALFRISTELAGALSNSPQAYVEALRNYGDCLGTAYQIYDDCLDLIGVEDATGKTLGTDLMKGKLTLPLLYVLQQLKGSEHQQLCDIILHGTAEDRSKLVGLIIERGGLQHSIRQIQEWLRQGVQSLQVLPKSNSREALQWIPTALSEHLNSLV